MSLSSMSASAMTTGGRARSLGGSAMRSPTRVYPAECRLVRFADVETIRVLSGQHMVLTVCDGKRLSTTPGTSPATLRTSFPTIHHCLATSGARSRAAGQ
jgi:hypothetical protein